jgi:hypothetical protein
VRRTGQCGAAGANSRRRRIGKSPVRKIGLTQHEVSAWHAIDEELFPTCPIPRPVPRLMIMARHPHMRHPAFKNGRESPIFPPFSSAAMLHPPAKTPGPRPASQGLETPVHTTSTSLEIEILNCGLKIQLPTGMSQALRNRRLKVRFSQHWLFWTTDYRFRADALIREIRAIRGRISPSKFRIHRPPWSQNSTRQRPPAFRKNRPCPHPSRVAPPIQCDRHA